MSAAVFNRKLKPLFSIRPVVVGSLIGSTSLGHQLKQARKKTIDVIEVRLDTFSGLTPDPLQGVAFSRSLLKKIRKTARKPILLTLRSFTEAGKKIPKKRRFDDPFRMAVLKPLLPMVQLIDVEIRHKSFARTLTKWAHQKKVGVIHSFHDFKGTVGWGRIRDFGSLSRQYRGDFFKIALSCRNQKKTFDFLENGYQLNHPHKILISMGPQGLISRTLGFSFGSLFTYGHLGQKAAPGQILANQLGTMIRDIYGDP